MSMNEYFRRGEKVVVVEVTKNDFGRKHAKYIGIGKVVSCEKSTINYSVSYMPWNPLITVVEIEESGKIVSNAPYTTKYEFYKINDYMNDVLLTERKKHEEAIREIDELIKELQSKK